MPKTDCSLSLNYILEKRAELLTQTRFFFQQRHVLEVEVPLLSSGTATDIHIESIPATLEQYGKKEEYYLITSPEFFMKRLLASGSPSIYFLGKAFRQGEHGSRHHHEFTMLEWYRRDWDEHQLMSEVEEFLAIFSHERAIKKTTYGELFASLFDINPYQVDTETLRDCVRKHCKKNAIETNVSLLTASDCFDFLFSHFVEPALTGITFVYNYPSAQAALAKITLDEHGNKVARRFEVFVDGLELANGYCELTDAEEQRQRFQQDLQIRRNQGSKLYPVDEAFLTALDQGLPQCSGVALGIDRLLMKLLNRQMLQDVIPLMT